MGKEQTKRYIYSTCATFIIYVSSSCARRRYSLLIFIHLRLLSCSFSDQNLTKVRWISITTRCLRRRTVSREPLKTTLPVSHRVFRRYVSLKYFISGCTPYIKRQRPLLLRSNCDSNGIRVRKQTIMHSLRHENLSSRSISSCSDSNQATSSTPYTEITF